MPLREPKYKSNQAILKDYGGQFYKLTCFRNLRTKGIEDDTRKKKGVNDEKLEWNVSRAKATVYELAVCNPWTNWATFTLDPKKYDRTNLDKFRKDFSQFLRDQGKKLNCKIDYLLVPELHTDGISWHMHGFIQGLPLSELRQFKLSEKLPTKLSKKLKAGDLVYDWTAYREKFGFNDLELVKNPEACCKYITTYLSKDIHKDVRTLGSHLYYSSLGLQRAVEMKRGTIVKPIVPTYENEYVRVQIFPQSTSQEDLEKMIL